MRLLQEPMRKDRNRGSDTLLLHPDTFLHSKPTPDRLKLIKEHEITKNLPM